MIPINTLLDAYRTGHFPMAVGGRLGWYSPEKRGVIPLDDFHVPRRLRREIRRGRLRTTTDRDFRRVIVTCASRPDDAGNWIDDEIIESYCALHEAGFAHSVEVWQGETLVGGTVRGEPQRGLLRRVDVSHGHERVQGGAVRSRRTVERARLPLARPPVAHAPPPAVRGGRGLAS